MPARRRRALPQRLVFGFRHPVLVLRFATNRNGFIRLVRRKACWISVALSGLCSTIRMVRDRHDEPRVFFVKQAGRPFEILESWALVFPSPNQSLTSGAGSQLDLNQGTERPLAL